MRGPRCCKGITPSNSARRFHNPAPILKKSGVKKLLASNKGCMVLELGSGCLRNALHLQSCGFRLAVIEVREMEARFPDEYKRYRNRGGLGIARLPTRFRSQIVMATFVIETICSPPVRTQIVIDAVKHLKKGGFFIFSVRGPSDLVTAKHSGVRCSDGYRTPNHTFARSYTRKQFARFLNNCGLKRHEFLHKKKTMQPELLHVIAWKE